MLFIEIPVPDPGFIILALKGRNFYPAHLYNYSS